MISSINLMSVYFRVTSPIGTVLPSLIISEIHGSKNYAQIVGILNNSMQIGWIFDSLTFANSYDKIILIDLIECYYSFS